MVFFIETLSISGKNKYFVKDFDNLDLLFNFYSKDQDTLVSYFQLPTFFSFFFTNRNIKLKDNDLIELLDSISLILKSGIPLYTGLIDIAETIDSIKFKTILLSIAEDIQNGRKLSEAMSKFPKTFSPMIINLVNIGEDSGRLHETLSRASFFIKRIVKIKKKTKSALIYPAFALFVSFISIAVWLIYVLPQVTELFKQLDVKLPFMTIMLIKFSEVIQKYQLEMFEFMFLFIFLLKLLHSKSKIFRFKFDQFVLKIPIIKEIIISFNMAFISEYLRISVISGLPLYNSLETLSSNINNKIYQKAIVDALKILTDGFQLSYALKQTKKFTPFTTRLIAQGEESGTLDDQLNVIAEHYNEKVDYYSDNISKFVEPVILIVVGGFIAIMMMALLNPIYDIVSKVA